MRKGHYESCMASEDAPVVLRPSCTEYLTLVDDKFDDKIVKRADFRIDDARTRHAGLKVSDFALTNQLASGVNMKPAMVSMSTLPYADRLGYEAECLRDFIERSKQNKSE